MTTTNDTLTYDTWARRARNREVHVGATLRWLDRCDPRHPHAYRRRQRMCRVEATRVAARYRAEVFGDDWWTVWCALARIEGLIDDDAY